MRALIYSTNKAPWGGSEIVWKDICIELNKQNVSILASNYKHPSKEIHYEELRALGISVQTRGSFNYPFSENITDLIKSYTGVVNDAVLNRYWREIKTFNPDIIIINAGEAFEFDLLSIHSALRRVNLIRKPMYLVVHFCVDQFLNLSQKEFEGYVRLYSLATKVIFVSEANKITVTRILGVGTENFTLLSGQVPPNKKKYSTPILNNKHLNLAIVARLEHEIKGQDIAIEYLSKYERKNEIVLNVYGKGPSKNYLESLTSFYNLSNQINFKNHVEDKSEIWKSNEMLLAFSQAEGLPLSLLEAMAHGRSFLSTTAGGVQNIPDNLGYTFHPTNRTYFYHLLDNLLDNRGTITEKGIDCHSWSLNQSVKTYYNQFFGQ